MRTCLRSPHPNNRGCHHSCCRHYWCDPPQVAAISLQPTPALDAVNRVDAVSISAVPADPLAKQKCSVCGCPCLPISVHQPMVSCGSGLCDRKHTARAINIWFQRARRATTSMVWTSSAPLNARNCLKRLLTNVLRLGKMMGPWGVMIFNTLSIGLYSGWIPIPILVSGKLHRRVKSRARLLKGLLHESTPKESGTPPLQWWWPIKLPT